MMINFLLIFFACIICILAGLLIWVVLGYRKLKQDFIRLSENVERNNRDIKGMCSAAVSVDNKIYNNREKLNEVVEKIDEFEQGEQEFNPPYYSAIQRVRQGADAEELIQQYGLSREEAELLIRLHGH